ncbi:hypothetical protein ACRALDRAFT_207096 [Sodiomyces alcalophilus JCM 7366]|uniref:uncharacterized protein n=1 Tax=Sodiomyces alcalophilus JCM 7366 TaxID=591952 RepID=UPI0039B524AC
MPRVLNIPWRDWLGKGPGELLDVKQHTNGWVNVAFCSNLALSGATRRGLAGKSSDVDRYPRPDPSIDPASKVAWTFLDELQRKEGPGVAAVVADEYVSRHSYDSTCMEAQLDRKSMYSPNTEILNRPVRRHPLPSSPSVHDFTFSFFLLLFAPLFLSPFLPVLCLAANFDDDYPVPQTASQGVCLGQAASRRIKDRIYTTAKLYVVRDHRSFFLACNANSLAHMRYNPRHNLAAASLPAVLTGLAETYHCRI